MKNKHPILKFNSYFFLFSAVLILVTKILIKLSKLLQLYKINILLMATSLCHRNGILASGSERILGRSP